MGAGKPAHTITHLSMGFFKLLEQTVKLSLKFNFASILRLCDAPNLEKVIFASYVSFVSLVEQADKTRLWSHG